jgi:nitroreductase
VSNLDFDKLVRTRRSVRKFLPDPISRQEIVDLLSLAIEAPSAGNEQMWRFGIIQGDTKKQEMAQIIARKLTELAAKTGTPSERVDPVIRAATLFAGAPAVIVVTTGPYRSKADTMLDAAGLSGDEIDKLRCRPDLQSIGSVVQTLLLAAWEKGLGTCWMCGPNVARLELEQYLGVQAPRTLAAIVALGKPAIVPASRGRLPVEEVITFLD